MSLFQVDVFAYGMVVYELLSQRSPYDDVQPALKRNNEVREGQRPKLQAKETRSLIQLQELMRLCWDKEPELRPKMSQVVEWIRAPELERLRMEVALQEVKSISCACVCRILPEYEPQAGHASARWGKSYGVNNGFGLMDSLDLSEHIAGMEDPYGSDNEGSGGGISIVVQNMLPSTSMYSQCIESAEGKKISNEGEDIYKFSKSRRMSTKQRRQRKGSTSHKEKGGALTDSGSSWAQQSHEERSGSGGSGGVGSGFGSGNNMFDPYTQIWMCGRDQRKGMLQIFTYNDGLPGYYVSAQHVHEEAA